LAALPDEKLGVAVATSMDVSNAVVERISHLALRLMVSRRAGRSLPAAETTAPVPARVASAAVGRYTLRDQTVEIVRRNARLYAWFRRPGFRVRLRSRGDTLVVDDRLWYGPRLLPTSDGLVLNGDTLPRAASRRPARAPSRWRGLVGEYGWDHNTLYVLERDGELHALIEWFFSYPLREVRRDVFAFPDWGLYHGEQLVFERDASGGATRVLAAGIPFLRRVVGTPAGETFRIEPLAPIDSLRAAALVARPPDQDPNLAEPDLVEVRSLDPTIRYDIRYATTNNFMGARFYEAPRAYLQRPAAEALVRVHRRLRESGYGLWQKMFVADPANGSRHNRGAAVDLTLYERSSGRPVEMTGGYDEFSDRSFPEYPGGTSLQRWYRELLRGAMEAEGFQVFHLEWWHFDYRDWRRYPILNLRFEELQP
jgi:D-alanyl-D-alanine dipeptidase